MKTSHLVLGLPVFIFGVLAVGLNLGPLLPLYPDTDLSNYLASVSIVKDFDIAYTREDSDRFFREHLRRPYPFQIVEKRILASDGEYKNYFAFYAPEIYVFLLAPFTSLFDFHGVLLIHTLLMAIIYWIGYATYKSLWKESFLPSLNSVVYFSLLPLPVLYLIPSHHLFLFAAILAAIYLGVSGRGGWSGAVLALAVSTQLLAILIAVLLIGFWQRMKPDADRQLRAFLFCLVLGCFVIWGIERLMYPVNAITETRWIHQAHQQPVRELWNSLPVQSELVFDFPSVQRVADFFFGRNSGFFVYGFPACALLLTSAWLWKQKLVKSILLFVVLFLLFISVSSPHNWNNISFTNDFVMILCAVCFFLAPITQSGPSFLFYIVPALVLAAPLLVDPLAAIINRQHYVQSLPYRLFPVEISLADKLAVLRNPSFQLDFPGGKFTFLNDQFYREEDFFWVHGESTVELLIQTQNETRPALTLVNGSIENIVNFSSGKEDQDYDLAPGESVLIDLNSSSFKWKRFGRHHFLHGKIESKSGYVPKLLSRDNPDYRYLGCQVRLPQNQSAESK